MADVDHDTGELRAGSAVGPYDLLAPIGVGGMARVWAARVRGRTDVVAVKMLLPELAENIEFRKMFFDEARIASRVRHPNVCSTFEMGEQHGVLYLAMEWLDGPSLMRVLRPGLKDVSACERLPIRPRLAARVVADACAGLHAAHELVGDDGRPLAVVHRDVSPHNLLITSAGEVKITDFGVAKALGKSHMTMAGQLKGKLAYMAPEQLVGGTVDRRCDVFALGCVLYEITTGQRPFQGDHDPQVMAAIVMGRYEPPASRIPSYPHELSIIVMRALANEPEHRYASADQMRQALENYLRASGPQVGAAQIAALVKERCGAETDARAASLQDEAAPSSDGRRAPRTSAETNNAFESGSGAMMIEGRPAASRRGALSIGVAALLGALLGLAVLSYVRAVRRARPTVAAVDRAPPSVPGPAASAVTMRGTASVPSSAPVGTGLVTAAGQGRVRLDDVDVRLVPVGRATSTSSASAQGAQGATAGGAQSAPGVTVSTSAAVSPRPRLIGNGTGAASKDASPPLLDAPPNPYE